MRFVLFLAGTSLLYRHTPLTLLLKRRATTHCGVCTSTDTTLKAVRVPMAWPPGRQRNLIMALPLHHHMCVAGGSPSVASGSNWRLHHAPDDDERPVAVQFPVPRRTCPPSFCQPRMIKSQNECKCAPADIRVGRILHVILDTRLVVLLTWCPSCGVEAAMLRTDHPHVDKYESTCSVARGFLSVPMDATGPLDWALE